MKKIFFVCVLMLTTSSLYAQTVSKEDLSPTPQDIANQKLMESDPIFPSIYKAHFNAIVGDLVNKQCNILSDFDGKALTSNVTISQQKLLPLWMDKHFKLSEIHKYKMLYDAAVIGHGVSKEITKDCTSKAAHDSVENGIKDLQCNLTLLIDDGQNISCFSFNKHSNPNP